MSPFVLAILVVFLIAIAFIAIVLAFAHEAGRDESAAHDDGRVQPPRSGP